MYKPWRKTSPPPSAVADPNPEPPSLAELAGLPTREQLSAEVDELMAGLGKGVDVGTPAVLDGILDSRLAQECAQLNDAVPRLTGLIGQRVAALEHDLARSQRELGTVEREHDHVTETMVKAYHELAGEDGSAPADHQGRADWRAFYDPGLVVGRGVTQLVHLVALLFAIGADLAAFYQVISLISNIDPWVARLLVGGFTALAVYAAHLAGTLLRRRRTEKVPAWQPTAALGLWFVLGAVAFAIRMLKQEYGETEIQQLVGALLYAALYLTSGVVALLGSYLTYNPWFAAYRKAIRSLRKLDVRLAGCEASVTSLERQVELMRGRLHKVEDQLNSEQEIRQALNLELKYRARYRIASVRQDPAEIGGLLS